MENNDAVQSILSELRRGVIVIAVLSQLKEEQYGYSLLKRLADQGFEMDQGTLYPLLRRLESQGLLQSIWRIEDDAHPRRYYVISSAGTDALVRLMNEWNQIVGTVQKML
ncbi:PadR family transcriptional regulator [Flexilinea flocculi]|jgi:DNA-binding PadR family transcriptional regulator|uniref:DNA-binding transcriptional regulator, PadR family n=1 Tax=Flexilinea flocculi TaxID=1678840 RepID=A0A0S7BHY9_9CHLR|nr:PadR family transcriptional regulator [Flexilinea flocculi]GAP40042.1 DNA-binding transcriptional regulator, PadR family [Flexilinea flocculi]